MPKTSSIRSAVLVELRLVTDGRTDTRAVKSHNRVFLIACFATDFRVYECVVFIDIVLFYDKISIRTVLRYCRV